MRELFATSRGKACWQERIQKEAVARATWHLRYGHKYLQEGARARARKQPMPSTGSPVSKEVQTSRSETQDSLLRAKSVESTPCKGDRVRQAKEPAAQSRLEGFDMKPAPPGTLKLLYQGISYDGQGRALYLQERYQQKPRDKFQYPILSSWEYGWHVDDVMKNYRTPTYARVQPITKTFYTKNSVFHVARRADQLM